MSHINRLTLHDGSQNVVSAHLYIYQYKWQVDQLTCALKVQSIESTLTVTISEGILILIHLSIASLQKSEGFLRLYNEIIYSWGTLEVH